MLILLPVRCFVFEAPFSGLAGAAVVALPALHCLGLLSSRHPTPDSWGTPASLCRAGSSLTSPWNQQETHFVEQHPPEAITARGPRCEEQRGPQTPENPGELRQRMAVLHSCHRALIPKCLALGNTHGAHKHFLASFAFSHPTPEPPPGHQLNLSLPMG